MTARLHRTSRFGEGVATGLRGRREMGVGRSAAETDQLAPCGGNQQRTDGGCNTRLLWRGVRRMAMNYSADGRRTPPTLCYNGVQSFPSALRRRRPLKPIGQSDRQQPPAIQRQHNSPTGEFCYHCRRRRHAPRTLRIDVRFPVTTK